MLVDEGGWWGGEERRRRKLRMVSSVDRQADGLIGKHSYGRESEERSGPCKLNSVGERSGRAWVCVSLSRGGSVQFERAGNEFHLMIWPAQIVHGETVERH